MLLIYNARLVDKNTDKKGAVLVSGKKIVSVLTSAEAKEYISKNKFFIFSLTGELLKKQITSTAKNANVIFVYDAKGLTLMPSFVDMHSHFRDPGFTQKEDIESGCKAAVAGGYGTVVCMPNTSPVISSEEQAELNDKKAEELNVVQLIQSVSITKNFDGKDVSHISKLNEKKVPLISEDGHEVESASVMLSGMKEAAKKKIIVSCHCEDPTLAVSAKPFRKEALELLSKSNTKESKKKAAELLTKANTLLALAEDTATFRNIRLAEEAKCHLHLCHVSTASCIEAVRLAKKNGDNLTCEITPHHLALDGTKAPNIFNIVNPPLRSEKDRLSLLEALKDGTADVIATDHAPHTAEDKTSGSPGFTGLETSFAVCNTELVCKKIITIKKLSALLSSNPAEILGLKNRGLIKENYAADLVLVDSNAKWKVDSGKFFSKGKYSPFNGKTLTGKVKATVFNGKFVFAE